MYVGTPRRYANNPVYTLASIIQGEAGGEGQRGMEAVASVIANRAASNFSGYGTNLVDQATAPMQFQGQARPSAAALAVAREAVGGRLVDPTHGATYYARPSTSQASWARNLNSSNALQIGHHFFTNNTNGTPFRPATVTPPTPTARPVYQPAGPVPPPTPVQVNPLPAAGPPSPDVTPVRDQPQTETMNVLTSNGHAATKGQPNQFKVDFNKVVDAARQSGKISGLAALMPNSAIIRTQQFQDAVKGMVPKGASLDFKTGTVTVSDPKLLANPPAEFAAGLRTGAIAPVADSGLTTPASGPTQGQVQVTIGNNQDLMPFNGVTKNMAPDPAGLAQLAANSPSMGTAISPADAAAAAAGRPVMAQPSYSAPLDQVAAQSAPDSLQFARAAQQAQQPAPQQQDNGAFPSANAFAPPTVDGSAMAAAGAMAAASGNLTMPAGTSNAFASTAPEHSADAASTAPEHVSIYGGQPSSPNVFSGYQPTSPAPTAQEVSQGIAGLDYGYSPVAAAQPVLVRRAQQMVPASNYFNSGGGRTYTTPSGQSFDMSEGSHGSYVVSGGVIRSPSEAVSDMSSGNYSGW